MVPSSFDRIPYDIFRQIILYSYTAHLRLDEDHGAYESLLWPPIEASHVCRSWRHALVADRAMWTFISFPDIGPEGVMELLHRSGSWALDVCIGLGGSGWYEIKDDTSTRNMLAALFDLLHRFKLLCLRITPTYRLSTPIRLQVLSYLMNPAPQLETFLFFHENDYSTSEPILITGTLFSGYAPRLKYMHSQFFLHCHELHSPIFRNLTELSLIMPDWWFLSPDQVLDLLDSSPKLKFLDLHIDGMRRWPLFFQHGLTRKVVLPDLQKIIIEAYFAHLIQLVLENVTFPANAEWHFTACDVVSMENLKNSLPQSLLRIPFTYLHLSFEPRGQQVEMFLEEKCAIRVNDYSHWTNRNTLVLRHKSGCNFADFWNTSAMKAVNMSHITRAVIEFEDSAQFVMIIFPALLASLTRVESLIIRYNKIPITPYFDSSLSFLLMLAVGMETLVQTQYPADLSKESVNLFWNQLYPNGRPSHDWLLPCLHLRELIVDVPNKLRKSQRETLRTCSRRRYETGNAVRVLIRYPGRDVLIM